MMKMKFLSAVVFSCLLCAFSTAAHSRVRRETGCPSEEEVEPCTCSDDGSLVCQDIKSAETLKTVFHNTARYTFYQLELYNSSLLYLPHEMFEETTVEVLILQNVTMSQLFDTSPKGGGSITVLHIQDTTFQRQLSWEFLDDLTNLKQLFIINNRVRILSETFGQHVTKGLGFLKFYATETRKIKPGALVEFINLRDAFFDSCKLNQITRDIFPNPFHSIRSLSFNNNNISSISEDMFTNMSNLNSLSLLNNFLTTVPEAAFTGSYVKYMVIFLQGNPLKCDCLLWWMVKDGHDFHYGRCAKPNRMKDKELQTLTPKDFNC